MLTRRHFIATGAAGAALAATPAFAIPEEQYEGEYLIPTRFRIQEVNIRRDLPAGEVHVVPRTHYVYFTLGNGRALRYGCAVGRDGLQFKGPATVGRKAEWPSWTPTANMIRREPEVYAKFAGGMPGGPDNPLGARALYLYRGGRDTLFRIHGTSQPRSIGLSVSSGCIRMYNTHVTDLYERVPMGTRVVGH